MRDGFSESDEAEAIRDQMDFPWRQLSPEEINRVDGMSADLYTLESDSPIQHPEAGGINSAEFAAEIKAARKDGDYDRILSLLRDKPQFISADRAAFLRGWCYEQLGEAETAELFFQNAARLDSANDLYDVFVVDQPSVSPT